MSADLVKAKWVGTFRAFLEDGTELIPGETVVEIPAGEAEESAHWAPQSSRQSKSKSKLAALREKADELGIDHSDAKSAKAVQKLIDEAQTQAEDSQTDENAQPGEGEETT